MRSSKTRRSIPWRSGLGLVAVFALGVVAGRLWALPSVKRVVAPRQPAPAQPMARVAIVIDDVGYTANTAPFYQRIHAPLTVAVLPHHAYSDEMARLAAHAGHEVILHLPLEPHHAGQDGEAGLEQTTILTTMSTRDIQQHLDAALASVPDAKGVNNHMGSKATEDPRVMEILLHRLKQRRLFFLDSLVTNRSVCSAVAERLGTRFAERDVFLDNQMDAVYIRRQLDQLVAEALADGSAVAIGHDRPLTLATVAEYLPTLRQRGIEVVPVSQLLR